MQLKKFLRAALTCAFSVLITSFAHGAITGPYSVDANTLHLWHLEDTTLPVLDSSSVATPINLQSLGTSGNVSQLAKSSYPGFGNGFETRRLNDSGLFALPLANGAADDTSMSSFKNPMTGAFTFEAILKINDPIDANSPLTLQIISADGDSNVPGTDRAFQFALYQHLPGEYELEFVNIVGGFTNDHLVSSNLTIVPSIWYHAAVTYNGAENTNDNLKLYWTEITPATTSATLVGSVKMTNDITTPFGDFAISAEARNIFGSIGQWNGMIDEVRISDIARGADQFIFTVPEPSVYFVGALSVLTVCRMRRPLKS